MSTAWVEILAGGRESFVVLVGELENLLPAFTIAKAGDQSRKDNDLMRFIVHDVHDEIG